MLIEIQEIEPCKLNIKFEADPIQVENKRAQVLDYFRNIKQDKKAVFKPIPGFRAGKAPDDIVSFHYKEQIEETLKNEMAQEAYHTVLAEKNIRPFGNPQFLEADLSNSTFRCSFHMTKLPDVELAQYKGFEIPRPKIINAIEMGEKIMQELRKKNGETVPFDDNDFVQMGDMIIVNYTGKENGVEVPLIDIEGELVTVGESPIKEFNDNILGMKVGEKRAFEALIPDDLSITELAGKKLAISVEVTMGSKNVPAALDDQLAIKVGAKDINELVSLAQSTASERVKQHERAQLAQQVSSRLIQAHTFDLPQWLITFETGLIAKRRGQVFEELKAEEQEELKKVAHNNVKLSLVLDKIRNQEPDCQLSDKEMLEVIQQKFMTEADRKQPLDKVLSALSTDGKLTLLMSHIKDEFVLDFIIKNSTIVE